MTEFVKLTDCASKSCWRGSTLVSVFLVVALAIGVVGGYAIANGATITAQGKSQTRETDSIIRRLATIESLVRDLRGPQ